MTDTGAHVKALRESRGLSLRELARQAGVSKSFLSELENGGHPYPGLAKIQAIAVVLEAPDLLLPRELSTRAPMMDRPAYELVRLIEAELDDGDQTVDTPQNPNRFAIWGIRLLLEPYGGRPHRWAWPKCFECDHQMPLHHHGPCTLCGCPITDREIADGYRDEALDDAVMEALRYEREHRG